MTHTPHVKFVLLSTARSGTTALVGGLRQHPDVFAHHAIFGDPVDKTVKLAFRKRHDVLALRENPVEFAEKILDFSRHRRCVGFKMWYGQSVEACEHVMADRSIKKIILERKNKLALASSRMLARASGTWHRRADQTQGRADKPMSELAFDNAFFQRVVRDEDRIFKTYRSQSRGDVFEMDYARLGDGILAELYGFLELPARNFSIMNSKLHSSDTVSRFQSRFHPEILRALQDVGHPEWISEQSGGNG